MNAGHDPGLRTVRTPALFRTRLEILTEAVVREPLLVETIARNLSSAKK
jgi:hypothetical protein